MKEGRKNSVLDGVPKELPALIKAYRIQNKAGRVGFDWDNITDVVDKISEELTELKHSIEKENKDEVEDELGDLLFSIVNFARKFRINPEDALRKTIRKFVHRFRFIEKSLNEQGINIQDATLEEMDRLWEDAKYKK